MPVNPTYPGVYIQELPSSVHTIVGVATSITAFIGACAFGPVNEPTFINSYADFERTFGGLWAKSKLGYAVRDFYLNGGSQAIIVRLYHAYNPAPDGGQFVVLGDNGLQLIAAYPGEWGNSLRFRIDKVDPTDSNSKLVDTIAQNLKLPNSDLLTKDDIYNLTICDTNTNKIEQIRNISVKPSKRQIDKVLAHESDLVRLAPTAQFSTDSVLNVHKTPGPKDDIWKDDDCSTGVKTSPLLSDDPLEVNDFTGDGTAGNKWGLYALDNADLFNLLCIPPYDGDDIDPSLISEAAEYCEQRRAMFIVDAPSTWETANKAMDEKNSNKLNTSSTNAMVYFPRLLQPDPLNNNQMNTFAPCGVVAGIIARTDAQRGIWKAPAGLEATLVGVSDLSVKLTDAENGQLNPLGVNCLRQFPAVGQVVWGARTLQGDDRLASEWKYIPVRRLTLYIEESLYRGTKWAVFEPNDEPLWSQLRLNLGVFMHDLFRQGAFQGQSPQEAYFVKCDKTTTTQSDIDKGIVNVIVGFAPVKPAEFIILSFQQIAGQLTV